MTASTDNQGLVTSVLNSDAISKAEPKQVSLQSEKSIVPTDNEAFRFLGAYWLYQDQIGWNRTQTLVAVEAGVLAGAFSKSGALSLLILITGALLVYWLHQLIQRDWQIRDSLGAQLGKLMSIYGIELLPQPSPGLPRGRTFVRRITSGVIGSNLVLAAVKSLVIFDSVIPPNLGRIAHWLLK